MISWKIYMFNLQQYDELAIPMPCAKNAENKRTRRLGRCVNCEKVSEQFMRKEEGSILQLFLLGRLTHSVGRADYVLCQFTRLIYQNMWLSKNIKFITRIVKPQGGQVKKRRTSLCAIMFLLTRGAKK